MRSAIFCHVRRVGVLRFLRCNGRMGWDATPPGEGIRFGMATPLVAGLGHERGFRSSATAVAPAVLVYRGSMSAKKPARAANRRITDGDASRGRIVDRITQDLRDRILDHTIAPGTVLIQTEWSEKLKVSRTPLRESFRILEQDGLVRVSNGNRTVQVVKFSATELKELYEVREVVDGLAARLLAQRGLEPELDGELAGLLVTMSSSVSPFDPAAWFSAHMAFHLRIAEASGNSRVWQQRSLVKMTSFSLHSYLAELGPNSQRLQRILEIGGKQHRAIYDAIRSGNGDLAEVAACGHIRTTLNSGLIVGAADSADAGVG